MQINIEHTRDIHELAKLNKTVQDWHHNNYPDEFKPFDINDIESAFGKMIQEENVFAFIAKYQGKSIGYLLGYVKTRPESAFQYEKTVMHIDQIAVAQFFQKHGVGRLLMEKAYQFARDKGLKEIQLEFWSGNVPAERFFSRNDFSYYSHRMKLITAVNKT